MIAHCIWEAILSAVRALDTSRL
ncbi:hypothetical protein VCRA2133E348_930005 [Vibrio crassostreae]|nr:hypothetical protein VCRA2133E348_930005 [Vibrio crassostreae]